MSVSITIDRSTRDDASLSALPAVKELPNLIGMDREEMAAAFEAAGVPAKQLRMRVGQVWQWIYVRGVSDFMQMSNISKDLRATLGGNFTVARPEIVERTAELPARGLSVNRFRQSDVGTRPGS